MFKHGKKLLVATLVLLVTGVSCNDNLLQTIPKDRVSSGTFWKTEQDARLAVNNLYNYLHPFGDRDIMNWAAVSDIATANGGFNAISEYQHNVETAESGFGSNMWNNSYDGIRACNEFLANVDNVKTDKTDLIKRYKAEARFVRSYLYVYLIEFFGDVPLIKKPITPKEGRNLSRTDKSKVWDFIASELSDISNTLPASYGKDQIGRITKGAALAMRARAMLYAGRYQEAANSAKAVMDMNQYSLYPSYEDLFTYGAEDNSEVILSKQFIKNDKSWSLYSYIAPGSLPQVGSDQQVVPSRDIVDAYEMKNGDSIDDPNSGYDSRNPYQDRDPRLDYTLFVKGDTLPNGTIYDPRPGFGHPDDITKGFGTTQTGFNIEKYISPQDVETPTNSGLNFIVIRYAEVLLTYAEAKIENGSIDPSVYDAINQVRQRPDVNMPAIQPPKTQDEMRQIVRHEREVELAFEGFRFFDIKRWKIAKDVMNGAIKGMHYVDKNGDLQTVTFTDFERKFTDRNYLWPIPQKEMDLNPDLKQNPGW